MAQYQIRYACGHTELIQLYGKSAEREKEIEHRENRLCKECWLAEQRKADEAVIASVKDSGLAPLVGSPKQVAWANGIRAKFFAEHGQKLAESAAVNEYASAFQSYLKGVQEASYWIETRDDPVEWRISKWKEIARKERGK